MIKDNQRHFNRLHVVIDAFILAAAYILAWAIQFEMLGGISGFLFQHYMSMLPFLIPLGLGLVAGIVPTTKVLERAMNDHPQPTYLNMLGFMLASLAELFPGVPGWPEALRCLLTQAAGFRIIWGITRKS